MTSTEENKDWNSLRYMANNLPLVLTRDLTLSTASLQDTDAFLVVTGNESTVRVPWSSMTENFITVSSTLPGTPTAEGEANQIAWDSEGVYTYYNGMWGKTPRLQTNWDDLTATTRFLRVDDTQNLSTTEQATARENIGVVTATTTSPGLVQLASDITSKGVPTTDIVRTYVAEAITEADIDIEGTVSVDKVQNYTQEQQLQGQANLGIVSATTTNEGLVQLADTVTVSSNVPTSAAVKTYVDAQDNAIKSYVDAAISDIPDTSTYWTLTSDNILTPADPAPTVAVREIIGALNEYGNRAPCLTIHADTSLEVESGSRLYLQASDMDVNATTIAIEGACSVGIYSTANITMSTTNGGVQVYGGHCGVLLESNRGIIALEDSSTGIRMETTNSTSINLTSADDINLTSADDINLKSTSSGAINLTTQGNITIDAGNTLYLSDSGKYGPYIENGVAYNFGNSGGGGGSGDGYWSFNEGSELLYTNHSIEAAELETSTVETYYIRNRDAAVLTLEAAGNDIKMIADKVRLTGYLTLTDSSSNEWMNIYRENSADRFRISTAFSGIYIDANSKPITLDGEPINIVAQNGNYYMPVVGGSTCGQSYSASNIQETYPSVWLGSKCYPTYIGGTNIKLTPCSEGKLYLPDYTQIMVGDKTWESATAVDVREQAYEVLLENLPVDSGDSIINTPTPAAGTTYNYNSSEFELDDRWVPAGKLNSISIMCRNNAGDTPMEELTVYACIREEITSGEWVTRAVSNSAVTQTIGDWGVWYFDNCYLSGNRIQVRALLHADDPVTSTNVMFGLRAAERSLSPYTSDTSTIGQTGDYIAQCRLIMDAEGVLDVAANSDLVEHVENMTMHLTADEHDALTDLIANGGSGSGDSQWSFDEGSDLLWADHNVEVTGHLYTNDIYTARLQAQRISSCGADLTVAAESNKTLYLSLSGKAGPYIYNDVAYNFGDGPWKTVRPCDSKWGNSGWYDSVAIVNNESAATAVRILGRLSFGFPELSENEDVFGKGNGSIAYMEVSDDPCGYPISVSALQLKGDYTRTAHLTLSGTSLEAADYEQIDVSVRDSICMRTASSQVVLKNGQIDVYVPDSICMRTASSQVVLKNGQIDVYVPDSICMRTGSAQCLLTKSQSYIRAEKIWFLSSGDDSYSICDPYKIGISGMPAKTIGFGAGTETAKFYVDSSGNLYAGYTSYSYTITSSSNIFQINEYSEANLVNCSNIVIDLTSTSSTPSSSSGWWYTLWNTLFAILFEAAIPEFRTWYVTMITGSSTKTYPAVSSNVSGITLRIPASPTTQAANTVKTIRVTKAGYYTYGEWLS